MISQQEFDDAMNDLVKAEAVIEHWQTIASQGIQIERELRAKIERLEQLRAALAPVAALKLWRDTYPDAAIDTLVDRNLAPYFTPDQVRRARELTADREDK
jgi:hypothetical protein